MKGKKITRTALYLMVIGVFNLIFFLLGGTDRTTATWIAYGFVHLAFLVSYIAPLFCVNYKFIPENLMTIYVFAWLYTLISLALNSVLIALNLKGYKFCIIINVALLVLYLIQLVINLNVNYAVEKKLEVVDAERQFVKGVSGKLKVCMSTTGNSEVRKILEKAYDVVRTSPLHSNDDSMNYEIEIIRLTGEIENKIDKSDYDAVTDIANEIISKTKKRNALL